MKNTIILAVLLLLSTSVYSQLSGDSLRTGRACKIVLYNGFQAEGNIVFRGADTVILQTDITKLHIPVKDIKFVLNPDVDISELEDLDVSDYEKIQAIEVKIDTTGECDIYFDDKSVYKDVKIVLDTDSTIKVIKEKRSKIIKIAGIRKIVFKPSAPFGKGYLIGSAIGFVVGFIPVAFSKGGGHPDLSGPGFGLIFGLICSIPTGLIGGVIGVLSAQDDVYLFESGIYPAKIKRIHHIVSKLN